MKKSIIALAVAGALAAPIVAQADATLYGTVAIDYRDIDGYNNDKGSFQLDDTIIGVKSSHELDGGLTSGAEIKFEQGSTKNISTTLANAYLTGGFGTVIAGKISNPVNDISSDIGTSDSQNYAGNGLTAAEIIAAAYVTPDMGGFSAYAGIVADEVKDDKTTVAVEEDANTVDAYMVGVKGNIAGLYAHLGYVKARKAGAVNDSSVTGLKLGYDIDALSLGAVITDEDSDTAEVDTWALTAGYDLGATDLYGFYVSEDRDNMETAKTLGVKATYALGTGTKTYAEWSKTKNFEGGDDDVKAITIGYAVSF